MVLLESASLSFIPRQKNLPSPCFIVLTKAEVQTHAAKPKTIEEVLAQVEQDSGVEERKAFEGFLKKMVKIKEEQGG